ncbi:hypothetical protein LCGC14_2404420, partial [marine sediment metagenome]
YSRRIQRHHWKYQKRGCNQSVHLEKERRVFSCQNDKINAVEIDHGAMGSMV